MLCSDGSCWRSRWLLLTFLAPPVADRGEASWAIRLWMWELSTPPELSVAPVAVLVRPPVVRGPAALLLSPESGEASAAATRPSEGAPHGTAGEGWVTE